VDEKMAGYFKRAEERKTPVRKRPLGFSIKEKPFICSFKVSQNI
jgi:hypothetical protein